MIRNIFFLCIVSFVFDNLSAMEEVRKRFGSKSSHSSKAISDIKKKTFELVKSASANEKDTIPKFEELRIEGTNDLENEYLLKLTQQVENSLKPIMCEFYSSPTPEDQEIKRMLSYASSSRKLSRAPAPEKKGGLLANFSEFNNNQDKLIEKLNTKLSEGSVTEDEIEKLLKPIQMVEQWKSKVCLRYDDVFSDKFIKLLEKVYQRQGKENWLIFKEKGDIFYQKANELAEKGKKHAIVEDFLIHSCYAYLEAFKKRNSDYEIFESASVPLVYLLNLKLQNGYETDAITEISKQLLGLKKFELSYLLGELNYHYALYLKNQSGEKSDIHTAVVIASSSFLAAFHARAEDYFLQKIEQSLNLICNINEIPKEVVELYRCLEDAKIPKEIKKTMSI